MKLDSFKKARERLAEVLRPTRLVHSDCFSQICGNDVYLKPENLQVTGAYKIRGAYYKISELPEEKKKRGIVTCSAGNHAQGVAYAASRAGVSATVVMPTITPLVKINNTKHYGAEVILEGSYFDESSQIAKRISEEQGLEFVHPFNDLEVATGQGTMVFEILEERPDTDIILVPVGGGGLAAGVSTLAKLLKPSIKVIGVEPGGAACMCASLQTGHICTLDKVQTIAEGVAVGTPGDLVYPYIRDNLDGVITVDDEEIPPVFLDMLENHKMIVENAGLISVCALRKLDCADKKVVCILSGGNMDVITMSAMVQHGLVARRRVFTFSLQLPDKPGELTKVTKLVSEQQGNLIRLEHNRFVNVNRNAAVELEVTLEAFGREHRDQIMNSLKAAGYDAHLVMTKGLY